MIKRLNVIKVVLMLLLAFSSVNAMQHSRSYSEPRRSYSKPREKSKRIFFISECLMNQNIRAYGVRNIEGDGPVTEILELLMSYDIGITVVECPELAYEGLNRRACGKQHYEQDPRYRIECASKAIKLVNRLGMYLNDGYKVGGFICVNGSPSCANDYCFKGGGQGKCKESGIFIEEVKKELESRKMNLRFIGYDRGNVRNCLRNLKDIILGM